MQTNSSLESARNAAKLNVCDDEDEVHWPDMSCLTGPAQSNAYEIFASIGNKILMVLIFGECGYPTAH